MKVQIVDPWATEVMVYYDDSLAAALAELGIDVTLLTNVRAKGTAPQSSGYRREYIFRILQGHSIFRKSAEYLAGILRLMRLVLIERPDVVHLQFSVFPPLEMVMFSLVRWLGTSVVFTNHDVIPVRLKWFHMIGLKRLSRSFDQTIVHSNGCKDSLVSFAGMPASRVSVVRFGDYHGLFDTTNKIGKASALSWLGIRSPAEVILFFGVLAPYKGLDVLIHAFKVIHDKRPCAALLVAGNPRGDERAFDPYQSKIRELGLESSVRSDIRHIPNNEVGFYFEAADVVALPYRRSGTSGVVYLAQAYAKPVVGTLVDGMIDAIKPGITGYLVPVESPEALADAIVLLLESPELCERMGQEGRRLFESQHDWRDCAWETLNAYREIPSLRARTEWKWTRMSPQSSDGVSRQEE